MDWTASFFFQRVRARFIELYTDLRADGASRERFFERRRLMIFRPARVDILFKKPWVLLRFLRFGLYVIDIVWIPLR